MTSREIVQAGLNLWARLTLCGCRDKPYLQHRTRRVHYTTYERR
jgi:hypothetical protein